MYEVWSKYYLFVYFLQIVAVGPDVPPEFKIGNRICVENHYYCGHCYQCTHGEYNETAAISTSNISD